MPKLCSKLACYAGIMLGALACLLCQKLCWHNRPMPTLHFIYLKRINFALQQFAEGWNSHGIRTERGLSPNQLFTAGVLRLRRSNLTAFDSFNMVDDNYGIDEDDSVADDINEVEDNNEGVPIPRSTVQLSDEQLRELQSLVNSHANDDNYGINLYQQVLEYLYDQ